MTNNPSENHVVSLLEKFNTPSLPLSNCCMYRVHNELREVKEKAYEPVLVSIGPYHRANEKLHMMEEYKLQYLKQTIPRLKNGNLVNLLSRMRPLVEEARNCYVKHVELDRLNEEQFTDMLVLDSCFVVEVIRESRLRESPSRESPSREDGECSIYTQDWMVTGVQRDLMLFENQLPFFIILKMVDLIVGDPTEREEFIQYAYKFFSYLLSSLGAPASAIQVGKDGKYKHLLEMIHRNWLRNSHGLSNPGVEDKKKGSLTSCAAKHPMVDNKKGYLIPCASKLEEAGVKFEIAPNNREGIFNIMYKKKVISIPNLKIYDITECLLRNFIVYEQYNDTTSRLVTDYVTVLDSLINSSKDVEILTECGIMDNFLGDGEAVADLFNKIVDSVNVSANFRYVALCKEVNDHYDWKMNKWLAKLKQTHFSSPWAIMSITAATMLLVLTAVQTVATVISTVMSMSDE